jgi:hypothetical protein
MKFPSLEEELLEIEENCQHLLIPHFSHKIVQHFQQVFDMKLLLENASE